MSAVEKKIVSREFDYTPPYLYNNAFALRCELGVGKGDAYTENAKARARKVFAELFGGGVDAFFFENRIFDFDADDGSAFCNVNFIVASEGKKLRFALDCQRRYRHVIVRDLPFDSDDNDELVRINRVVCFPHAKFDAEEVIDTQIDGDERPIVHLVSYANDCIFTVYDDRGLDIVFFDAAKLVEFYPRLEKYFLDYDRPLMKERYEKALSNVNK